MFYGTSIWDFDLIDSNFPADYFVSSEKVRIFAAEFSCAGRRTRLKARWCGAADDSKTLLKTRSIVLRLVFRNVRNFENSKDEHGGSLTR